MRARDVVGRRIVAVRQTRVRLASGRRAYHLDALVLDDGTTVNFDVAAMEEEYIVEPTVWEPPGRER
jgi:hypothetical protein